MSQLLKDWVNVDVFSNNENSGGMLQKHERRVPQWWIQFVVRCNKWMCVLSHLFPKLSSAYFKLARNYLF